MENGIEIAGQYPWQMWAVFGVIALAIALYMTERIPIVLSSLGILTTLILFFNFFPLEAVGSSAPMDPNSLLMGFANPALITIMALLVIGQGMFQSEALEDLTHALVRLGMKHARLALIAILISVFCVSAWLNNTPVAVMFIPVLAALAARTGGAPDQIMMPLSFTCILGGMTTLIGSSTNILAVDIAARFGAPEFGFFDITKPGLMLAIPGLLYVLFVMPHLLPRRGDQSKSDLRPDGRHYIAQIDIGPQSLLIGLKARAGLFIAPKKLLQNMTVLRVQRGSQSFYPPFEDVALSEGDRVIIAATRPTLTDALKSRDDIFGLKDLKSDDRSLADAVIAPASRMIGRSISQLTLQYETGCHVLGIQRRRRMIRTMLHNIRFEAGDVLLIVGSRQAIRDLSHTYDVFLLEWSATDLPSHMQSRKALAIFGTVVIAAATGFLPLVAAALLGASAMLMSRVLNIRQAVRALDQRVFFLVATAIGLSVALEASGGPKFLTSLVMQNMDASPLVILAGLFLLIALVTNVLSNNAAAVLFTPIVLESAEVIGFSPELGLITVILAANCSFATPMAYQTNLLVMGPGRYQFKDFIIAGTPLIFLMWIAYIVMAKMLYGL